jgi:hypothetical protein
MKDNFDQTKYIYITQLLYQTISFVIETINIKLQMFYLNLHINQHC